MKTTLSKLLILLAIASFAIVTGCKKENSGSDLSPQEQEQASIAISEADAESEIIFNDIFDNVMGVNNEVGLEGTGVFGGINKPVSASNDPFASGAGRVDTIPSCVVVTVVKLNAPNPFPLKITVDFGAGCTDRHGHTRSGKVITTYTGRLIVPGKSATTIFDNYKINGISVTGEHKITNTSTSNVRQFTVDVTNAKLTKPNGNYSKWNSHRVITQVEGLGTPELPIDDVFTITGSSSGEVKRETFITTWESVIIEPLRKRFACPWISKGTVKIIRRDLPNTSPWIALLDYGTGTCDNKATLTINGIVKEITLH